MKLSMQISCFVLLVILGFSSSQEEGSLEYTIPIGKVFHGGKTADNPIIAHLVVKDGKLQVWFEPDVLPDNMTSISVYLANGQKNLRQIIFEGSTMMVNYYVKPWQYAGSKSEGVNVKIPTSTSPATIPSDWLPENISKVSASAIIDEVIYNYYGIKNFAISMDDTFIVENYKDVDLTSLTPSQ